MKNNDLALPDGPGSREPSPSVSALRASIPSAVRIVSIAPWASCTFSGAHVVLEGVELPEDADIPVKGAVIADILPSDNRSKVLLVADNEGQTAEKLAAALLTALSKLRASGIAAQSDETLQAAQPEGQEPGPQGDAQNQGDQQ